ncbi:hypothetical protein [Streptomyces oryzae]|nr:hypothetical protein [Streptomyces oryzae]
MTTADRASHAPRELSANAAKGVAFGVGRAAVAWLDIWLRGQ